MAVCHQHWGEKLYYYILKIVIKLVITQKDDFYSFLSVTTELQCFQAQIPHMLYQSELQRLFWVWLANQSVPSKIPTVWVFNVLNTIGQ